MSRGRRRVTRALVAVAATVLSAGLLTSCGTDGTESAEGVEVGVEAFVERIESNEDVVVLDVRTPEEYAAGHLPDALNVDVNAADFAARIDQLDPDATYAVYCRSGNRSAVAVDHMIEAGFDDVEHLGGGIGAWQAAGGPVER